MPLYPQRMDRSENLSTGIGIIPDHSLMVSFAGMIVFVAMGRKQIDKQKIRPQERLRSDFFHGALPAQHGVQAAVFYFRRG